MRLITLIRFLLFIVLVNSLDGHEITTIWSQRMNDQVNDGMSSEVTTEIGSNNSSDSSSFNLKWLFPSFRNSSENSTRKYLEAEQRSSFDDEESSTNWSERNLMVTEESITEMSSTEGSTGNSTSPNDDIGLLIIVKWLLIYRNSSEIQDAQRNKSNLVMEKRSNNELLNKTIEECEDEANYKKAKLTTQKPIETTNNELAIINAFPQFNITESSSFAYLNGTQSNGWFANWFTFPSWYSGFPWIH